MGVMGISWGDTLSQIAARIGTSVFQLAQTNGIADPDFILAGTTLQLPPGSDGPDPGVTGAQRPVGVEGPGETSGGDNAAAIAEQFLGRNAGELKYSDELPMEDWVPNNVNCANFVSACLQKAGVIDPSQASASVDELASNLKSAGWQTVSLQDARPGDVVLMQKNGQSHVVLFAGFENGEPRFIGSNNINPDGSQQISWGGASGDYEIITPPR